ncbi:DUF3980 domain-containing protein [Priestia taiwanensis]|uniref:DUF3980 domain-containing protein n=1 Tax=Priestia taiwanensis TaxID=1347902 RepID=A0A917ARA5_9BACI|nr:DUF3980 domain-containing protein [Priestia taiwanensis]MBM7363198.1 putative membrane protein [Priestia taiwanensis]GGE68455.1 hypothetical protein GCM10007140_18170 [Priestia taiwanensis]
MYVRKCSRCQEKTSTVYGGKKFGEEFLCEECIKKAVEAGEIELPSESDEPPKYTIIKVLKVVNVLYLVVSLLVQLSIFSTFSSMAHDVPPEMGMSVSVNGVMGGVSVLALIQTILIFSVVWVFILLVETVVKIYHKMK